MARPFIKFAFAALTTACLLAPAARGDGVPKPKDGNKPLDPAKVDLPPAVTRDVSFMKDVKPLLEASCVQCHAKGKAKGGLSIETRAAFLKGGDDGPAAVVGKSGESMVVQMVAPSADADSVMPKKGTRWTAEQVGVLRAWIDQGMKWDEGVSLAKPVPNNLHPRAVPAPAAPGENPLDGLLATYLAGKNVTPPPAVVDDRAFARRLWLDAVGLLPPPADLEAFVADKAPDKRAKLVQKLLADPYGYADHWLTFWNDLLRNDYKGTGFIDGGRRQITGWLYSALLANKPYDQFVKELVAPPSLDASGFTYGIVWRGSVPAAMTPPMQAGQNVSQVFFGVNLKCASCHDSFVNDWTLADAYGLAAIYSDKPLEMVHCDRPTGKNSDARFLYPEIGTIDPKLSKADRMKRFAELLTSQNNGRLSRNIVNRVWAKLLGRGLVEPVDDMDKPAWCSEMLDWLAEDLTANKFDLKRTIGLILSSRAYQLAAVDVPDEADKTPFVFRGPYARRLSAEQYADALDTLTGEWARWPSSVEVDFTANGAVGPKPPLPAWLWTSEPVTAGVQRSAWAIAKAKSEAAQKAADAVAAAVTANDPKVAAVAARAKAAADDAVKTYGEAELLVRSGERAAQVAAGADKLDPSLRPYIRHQVVFRKTFTLDALPTGQALAMLSSSQRAEMRVNGQGVGMIVGDSRSLVFDIRHALVVGENQIAIGVDSHTERPNVPLEDRDKIPAALNHLNDRSGVAFQTTFVANGKTVVWGTDDTWVARRAPDAAWRTPKYDDKGWAVATKLADGTGPSDDGSIIDDDGRKPAGLAGNELGNKLYGLVALTTHDGRVRTALRTADPLQLALGRPNREMVTSYRQDMATTIQALELTNGSTLDEKLKRSAAKLAAEAAKNPAAWADTVFRQTVSRPPTDAEKALAVATLGPKPSADAVADFLWALTMQPEFQYVR